jgi:hypothetical protein
MSVEDWWSIDGSERGRNGRHSLKDQVTVRPFICTSSLTMAAPPIKPKTTEVEAVAIHKIRITLTSRNVCSVLEEFLFIDSCVRWKLLKKSVLNSKTELLARN